jgi:hypothetical protein
MRNFLYAEFFSDLLWVLFDKAGVSDNQRHRDVSLPSYHNICRIGQIVVYIRHDISLTLSGSTNAIVTSTGQWHQRALSHDFLPSQQALELPNLKQPYHSPVPSQSQLPTCPLTLKSSSKTKTMDSDSFDTIVSHLNLAEQA